MNRYLHDGTAEGLLCAAAYILANDPDPENAVLSERGSTLFESGLFIATSPATAEEMFSRLHRKAPNAALTLYYFMLAGKKGVQTRLAAYLALALSHGDRVDGHLTHPAVQEVVALSKKVARELHRMKGLLRFEKLPDGAYLAKMQPDHNILQPLSGHFIKRLGDQEWFIYDVGRRAAAHWDRARLRITAVERFDDPGLAEEEKRIQVLWRTFFHAVAISGRKNPRLQKSNMPMKYWRYLTEKKDLAPKRWIS